MNEAYIRVTHTPAGKLSVVPSEVRGDTESPAPALIVPSRLNSSRATAKRLCLTA